MSRDSDFADYARRAAPGGIVPVVRELAADTLTPVTAYAAIARPPFAFLLESLVGGERWARYTFMGTEPREAWRYRGGAAERWTAAAGWEPPQSAPDPLGHLGARLRTLRPVAAPGLPRFTGGAVGYLGYDVVRTLERLPGGPADQAGLKVGDMITTVDGKALKNGDALVADIASRKPGTKATLGYLRNGKTATASVTIGSRNQLWGSRLGLEGAEGG